MASCAGEQKGHQPAAAGRRSENVQLGKELSYGLTVNSLGLAEDSTACTNDGAADAAFMSMGGSSVQKHELFLGPSPQILWVTVLMVPLKQLGDGSYISADV